MGVIVLVGNIYFTLNSIALSDENEGKAADSKYDKW